MLSHLKAVDMPRNIAHRRKLLKQRVGWARKTALRTLYRNSFNPKDFCVVAVEGRAHTNTSLYKQIYIVWEFYVWSWLASPPPVFCTTAREGEPCIPTLLPHCVPSGQQSLVRIIQSQRAFFTNCKAAHTINSSTIYNINFGMQTAV